MTSITPFSNTVTIFPCVSRTDNTDEKATKAKLMSEENITNIIKSITDKKSYVLDYSEGKFKFILDGYYIELETSKEGTKYVSVNKDTLGTYEVIQGDDGDVFSGLSITDEPTEGPCLCLCVNGEIPQQSYQKFELKSLNFDFGELK